MTMTHKHRALQAILSSHLGEKIDRLHYKQKDNELTVHCHVPKDMRGRTGTYVCLVTLRNNTYSSCTMINYLDD